MKTIRRKSKLTRAQLAGFIAALGLLNAAANPVGLSVARGNATVTVNGQRVNITVSDRAFLNWRTFNIAKGETTTFIQPSSSSIVINRISEAGPSQIWGSLNANGTVILANSHGFYFGPGSMIQVGGSFVATTAPLTPDFGGGGSWQFNGLPPLANIVNYGEIESSGGGSLFLIAEHVENHGELNAPGGSAGLYAGKEVLVSLRPDGRGLSAAVTLPSGSVDNSGRITANGGDIALRAQVVNQHGVLQADSIRERNGVIELVASESLALGEQSQILSRGDGSGNGRGGEVTLKSDGSFADSASSQIITTGGAHGGNGGNVEVSAHSFVSLDSTMDARAQSGFTSGRLLIDPLDIILNTSGTGSAGNGTIPANTPGTLALNVNTAFLNKNFSEITLQATRNITLAAGTVWDLSLRTGLNEGQLTLQAGNNITFENNARIFDANNWSVRLEAGVDFNTGQVQSGVGSVFLNGGAGRNLNGAISTAHGNIDITAGQDVLVGIGYVRTTAGGNIHARALNGDVDAGKNNDGYQFTASGYGLNLANDLGGISTAHGGNVTLEAGRDVISIPTLPAGTTRPGASGAYGAEAGDVTIIAGRQVLGNYLVRNGQGTIQAGVTGANGTVTGILNPAASVGTTTRPLSLSLVSGDWNVWSGGDIFLNEVRNPNGTFNGNRLDVPAGAFPGNIGSPAATRVDFLIDYAPDASVSLWANNHIALVGSNLPRVTGRNQNMQPIYAPRLSLNAGAGGIEIRNNLTLYPSAQGALEIITRDGGDLIGRQLASALVGITMSDSGSPEWSTFKDAHAAVPLHLHDPNPVRLDISGNVENFNLTVPTAALIHVAGDTYNFGFLGQNLSHNAVTSIRVDGDICYRGNLTDVTLTEPLPASLLNPLLSASASIALRLRYDATTQKLTYVGLMTDAELAFLLNPSVLVFDRFGEPVLENGVQKTEPVVLSAVQKAAVQQLYTDSQSASLGDNGLGIAGAGQFNVRANNVSLGISRGIYVAAPNAALEAITPFGADIRLDVAGNLDMTSSRVANFSYLGDVTVTAGGKIDIGSQLSGFGDQKLPKGIFTTGGGDVRVFAQGDVNVNGSRIATYSGGNINVKSFHGDVKAGSGGSSLVEVNAIQLDPVTGKLVAFNKNVSGSGIFATTLKQSLAQLGNITVETPEGSISASAGGIVQLARNKKDQGSLIDLNAGLDIDASGSGVIGRVLRLKAGRDILGNIIGTESVDIDAIRDVNVIAFSPGGISISADGKVSGTVIGGDNVSVSGDSITADVIAKNASVSGDATGATVGVPTSDAPKTETKLDDGATTAAKATESNPLEEDDLTKKKKAALAKLTGRVTLILPNNK